MSGSRAGVHMLLAVWDPAGSLPKGRAMLGVEKRQDSQCGVSCATGFLSTVRGVFNNMDQGWLKKKLNISPPSQSGVITFENWMQCLP